MRYQRHSILRAQVSKYSQSQMGNKVTWDLLPCTGVHDTACPRNSSMSGQLLLIMLFCLVDWFVVFLWFMREDPVQWI